jgi:hypothetical protein
MTTWPGVLRGFGVEPRTEPPPAPKPTRKRSREQYMADWQDAAAARRAAVVAAVAELGKPSYEQSRARVGPRWNDIARAAGIVSRGSTKPNGREAERLWRAAVEKGEVELQKATDQ